MRVAFAFLICCALAGAEDLVHLRGGGVLRGTVKEERADLIVLDLGTGTIRIPRDKVRLVERNATGRPARRQVTRRDEWFLVFHNEKLVGWRRVVHTEGPERLHVEERTAFFRPGGGEDVEVRRVEVADREGNPIEFLFMERYGSDMEVVSGQVEAGVLRVQVRRDGKFETKEVDLPRGWVLALPAWSRFLHDAKAGEARTISALDPRRLRLQKILLRREQDAAAGSKPWRSVTRVGDVLRARALYRPGDGALSVELNGSALVARRATRARVELAQRANSAPRPLSIKQALRYPFHKRSLDLRAYSPRAGLTLRAPDAGWIPKVLGVERGLVLSFEKVAIFASLEAFVYPLPNEKADLELCMERALARLRLTAESTSKLGSPMTRVVAGRPIRVQRLAARHRGESLRCMVAVVTGRDRYAVLVGAALPRSWRWAEKAFDEFVGSVVLTD